MQQTHTAPKGKLKRPAHSQGNAAEAFDPSERAREAREDEDQGEYNIEPWDTHSKSGASRKRERRKPRNDGMFALSIRLPNKYKYAVTMEALQAESAGEFQSGGRRDTKQAYLEHVIVSHLEDLLEKHPFSR